MGRAERFISIPKATELFDKNCVFSHFQAKNSRNQGWSSASNVVTVNGSEIAIFKSHKPFRAKKKGDGDGEDKQSPNNTKQTTLNGIICAKLLHSKAILIKTNIQHLCKSS